MQRQEPHESDAFGNPPGAMSFEKPSSEKPLESWKEIAAYLQRNAVTVRRWERQEGLPIHRHRHKSRASVYAFPSELNTWREGRKPDADPEPERIALWGSPWSSFATASLLLLALFSVGSTTSELLRGQGLDSSPNAHLIWSDDQDLDVRGTVSADGRYLSFTRNDGNIAVRDLVAGTSRQLALDARRSSQDNLVSFALASAISRDGLQVAYSYWDPAVRSYDLRLVPVADQPTAEPRRLYINPEAEAISPVNPRDWSPDGKWIAVEYRHTEARTASVGLISVSDGSYKSLKTLENQGYVGNIRFSPDGRFLAFAHEVDRVTRQRDITVIAVDGSSEAEVVTLPSNDTLAGWAPDGSALIFGSNRSGSQDLWSIPVVDGQPAGTAQLLHPNVPSDGYLTASGAYYYHVDRNASNVYIASVDWETGAFRNGPVNPVTPIDVNRWPRWSPDGERLAFMILKVGTPVMGILSPASGAMKELVAGSNTELRWSPDGESIAFTGYDKQRNPGIFQVNVASGEVSELVPNAGETSEGLEWSGDGTKLYYVKDETLWEWDIPTSRRREVFVKEGLDYMAVSPDRQWIAYRIGHRDPESGAKSVSLWLAPFGGGTPRELMADIQRDSRPGWTPDSASILVNSPDRVVTQVFLSGQPPKSLEIPFDIGPVSVHPDGNQVAYWLYRPTSEWWVLENFLPTPVEP